MGALIRMRALVAFVRGGRLLEPGELFQAVPVEAAALRYQGKAAFAVSATAVQPTKRRYRRRDLQAEDTA